MKTVNILIVSHDERHVRRLSMLLDDQGYTSLHAHSIRPAKQIATEMSIDIAVIDVKLKDVVDGLRVAKVLQGVRHCPVVLITSKASRALIERCKEPYIYELLVNPNADTLTLALENTLLWSETITPKQSLIEQLSAEAEALKLRYYKSHIKSSARMDFGDGYHYDERACVTYYHGERLPLTVKENALLRLLAASVGLTVTFHEMAEHIWDEDEKVLEEDVRTLVWRLRQVLPTDIIESVAGKGYRIK